MRASFVALAAATLLAAACTSTDASDGPIATPQPPTVPPVAEPLPTIEPAPQVADPSAEAEDNGRPTVEELIASPFPLNIAHAGGDQSAPHSTLFAYSRAVEEGAVVLELDVQLSADGVLVVHHDATVEGTTNGTGRVDELTLAELKELDNAHWFSPTCWPCRDLAEEEYVYRGVRTGAVDPPDGFAPEDFTIATFREVVERFPTMAFDIEIKVPDTEFAALGIAAALADEITALGIERNVVVVSFSDAVVGAFERLAPGVETSPGQDELTAWFLLDEPLAPGRRILQMPPTFEGVPLLTDTFWEKVEAQGLEVWIFPDDVGQESQAFYQELVAMGVDGVIAGRPNEMAATLG